MEEDSQNKQLDFVKGILSSDTIVFGVLAVFGYMIAFAFEAGYLFHFRLPIAYVNFDTVHVIIAGSILAIGAYAYLQLMKMFISKTEERSYKETLVSELITAFFILLCTFLAFGFEIEFFGILTMVILFLLFSYIKKNDKNDETNGMIKSEIDLLDTMKIIRFLTENKIVKIAQKIIKILGVLMLLSFMLGHSYAAWKSSYDQTNISGKNYILVYYMDDTTVLGVGVDNDGKLNYNPYYVNLSGGDDIVAKKVEIKTPTWY
jgi:hypothetical protein